MFINRSDALLSIAIQRAENECDSVQPLESSRLSQRHSINNKKIEEHLWPTFMHFHRSLCCIMHGISYRFCVLLTWSTYESIEKCIEHTLCSLYTSCITHSALADSNHMQYLSDGRVAKFVKGSRAPLRVHHVTLVEHKWARMQCFFSSYLALFVSTRTASEKAKGQERENCARHFWQLDDVLFAAVSEYYKRIPGISFVFIESNTAFFTIRR